MALLNKIKNFGKRILLASALCAAFSMPCKAEQVYSSAIETSPIEKIEQNDKKGIEQKLSRQENDNLEYKLNTETEFDAKKWFIELPAYSLLAFPATVIWHEFGHTRTAFYLGWKINGWNGPDLSIGRIAGVSVSSDKDATDFDRRNFCFAGVNATTAMSEFLYQSLKTGKVPEKIKPLTAVTALFMMADRHRYLWSSAIKNFLKKELASGDDFYGAFIFKTKDILGYYYTGKNPMYINGTRINPGEYYDIIDNQARILQFTFDEEGNWREAMKKDNYIIVTESICENNGKKSVCYPHFNPKSARQEKMRDISYGIAFGMSALELGLRFKQIKYLVGTALGSNPEPPSNFDIIHAGLYPIKDGFIFSIAGEW